MPSPVATKGLVNSLMLDRQPYYDPATRYDFFTNFTRRPVLIADLEPAAYSQAAQRILNHAEPELLLSGTNMTTALATFAANGGVTLTTAGANNDQAIVAALGITAPAGLQTVNFDPAFAPQGRFVIETGASIASLRILAGFRLTAVNDETTDNDFALISFNPAVSNKWRFISRIGGATVVTNTTLTADVLASTKYELEFQTDSGRRMTAYINGVPFLGSTAALTSGAAFKPIVSVMALAAAAKAVTLHSLRVSRRFAA